MSISQRNYRAALDAATALRFHIGRQRRGASERGRSTSLPRRLLVRCPRFPSPDASATFRSMGVRTFPVSVRPDTTWLSGRALGQACCCASHEGSVSPSRCGQVAGGDILPRVATIRNSCCPKPITARRDFLVPHSARLVAVSPRRYYFHRSSSFCVIAHR